MNLERKLSGHVSGHDISRSAIRETAVPKRSHAQVQYLELVTGGGLTFRPR
jgi:hypothetical protein